MYCQPNLACLLSKFWRIPLPGSTDSNDCTKGNELDAMLGVLPTPYDDVFFHHFLLHASFVTYVCLEVLCSLRERRPNQFP